MLGTYILKHLQEAAGRYLRLAVSICVRVQKSFKLLQWSSSYGSHKSVNTVKRGKLRLEQFGCLHSRKGKLTTTLIVRNPRMSWTGFLTHHIQSKQNYSKQPGSPNLLAPFTFLIG